MRSLLLIPLAALAANPVPPGFQVAARSGPIGQTLLSEFPANSARTTLPAVVRQVSPYFDRGQLSLDAAISDRADQQAQAFFRAAYQGAPVRGRFAVFAANGKGSAAVFFDRADRFGASASELTQGLAANPNQTASRAATPAAPLRNVNFGTGAIGVPDGWRINSAQNGGVDIGGPAGEGVSLGNPFTIPVNGPPGYGLTGPYLPPDQALVAFLTQAYRGQARVRILESSPQSYQGGQAAYLHYEFIHQTQGAYQGLAMVITSPMTPGYWQYYQSLVHAPKPRFAQSFPTMWAMWKSWSLNPALLRQRMDAALATMREIHAIQQGVTEDRSRSAANRSYAVGQLLQGVTSIEHVDSRYRTDVNANNVHDLLRELNRNGNQWQEVPLERINPNYR